jgi:hypothetical protein
METLLHDREKIDEVIPSQGKSDLCFQIVMFLRVCPDLFHQKLPTADGGKYTYPVVIFEHPIVTFVVVVDHGQEANNRVDRQNRAKFPNSCAIGNFKVKGDFPEIWEIGVIAF